MPQTKIRHTEAKSVNRLFLTDVAFNSLCMIMWMYATFISIFLHLRYIQKSVGATAAADVLSNFLCFSLSHTGFANVPHAKWLQRKWSFYFNGTHTQRQTQIVFIFVLYSCENSCRQRVFQLSFVHNAASCVCLLVGVFACVCVSIFLVVCMYTRFYSSLHGFYVWILWCLVKRPRLF